MRRAVLRSVVSVVLMGSSLLVPSGCLAQTVYHPTTKQEKSLGKFLQDYLRDPRMGEDRTTRYYPAFVDLKEDGTQAVIVYITGQNWCGSGGCTMLILAPQTSSYRVVARFTITWPPVRVLATKSHGWHGIAIWMQGGGIEPGYEAEFSFNGKTYVSDDKTSLRPSKRLRERVLPGKVVIPSTAFERADRLYP
jgi:hypothetical protein